MNEWLDVLLSHAGPWLLPLLGVAAFVEYVFPPFPGDLAMAIGAFAAVHGGIDPALLVFVATAGSVLGAAVDFAAGIWVKRHVEQSERSWVRRLLPPDRLERMEAQYRRWGLWLVIVNRFLPGTRAFIFVFAGASRLPFGRTMAAGAISALVWNGLLIALGYMAGENRQLLEEMIASIQIVGLAVVVVIVVGGVAWWWRRRAQANPE